MNRPTAGSDWDEQAEAAFWAEYDKKRAGATRTRLATRQMRALAAARPEAGRRIGERLVADVGDDPDSLTSAHLALSEVVEASGDRREALDQAVAAARAATHTTRADLEGHPALARMVDLVAAIPATDRVDELFEVLDATDAAWQGESARSRASRDLMRASVLALAGRDDEARALVAQVRVEGIDVKGLPVESRARERLLFAACRVGGAERFLGLLASDSALGPDRLRARLEGVAYFRDAAFEEAPQRLVVDLEAFSLDITWSSSSEEISRVQSRYEAFRWEDRRHIPPPPDQVALAMSIKGIGDDTSIPDVVNPLIELTTVLDVGECVFMRRVGPLSRSDDAEPVEKADVAVVERQIRAELGPLLTEAGMSRVSARRYEMTSGGLGHYATVHVQIGKNLDVELYFVVYYRDLMTDNDVARNTTKQGKFRPKPNAHAHALHLPLASARWRAEPPTEEGVASMMESIREHLVAEVLPIVVRTADPVAELEYRSGHVAELRGQRVRPDSNRFGVATKAELLAEMAALLGESDLEQRFRSS